MRVLHVTDTHLVAERNPAETADDAEARLLGALAAIGPVDAVIHTGDITDDFSEAATRRMAEILAPLASVVVGIPGNHDRPSVVAKVFPVTDVDVDGWRILGLNSVVEGEIDGVIDAEAVAALIDRRGDVPHTLLAIHHPLRSRSTHPWFQLAGADDLMRVVAERAHVHGVISGHTHEQLDWFNEGVRLISGPSTWYSIAHDGNKWTKHQGPTGVQLLDLSPDGRIEVVKK